MHVGPIGDIRTSARGPCLIVAAHPDDEVIGASSVLMRRPDVLVVHVTTGAPRDRGLWPSDAPEALGAYAALRRREAEQALSIAGVEPERILTLGLVDQEATLELPRLTCALETLVAELGIRTVFVHPYEGGHPDHDACSFAARAMALRSDEPPTVVEMTSYHRWGPSLRTGRFLPADEAEHVFPLRMAERDRKLAMLAAYSSQRGVLEPFQAIDERFRIAPAYDFARPPLRGVLHYESLGWPMRGLQWCELAVAAARELSLPRFPSVPPPCQTEATCP